MKQKSHIKPIVYVMITVFLTIGYAYLTSNLTINGSTLLKKPTWDVHFENVQVKDGSVTGEQVTQEPTIDDNETTVTFHVNLKLPGDFYEFTVDAVNAGTIDAMIDNYSDLELTEDQQKYLETSITYEDGEEVLEHQQLLAGDTAVYKVRVAYKLDLEAEDLPDTPEQLDLEFSVEFVQRDNSSIRRRAENLLYNVLKNEFENGNLALKYNGVHQDSMDASLSTKDVYYWYPNDSTFVDAILDKSNVIFAGYCWQIIRTTDTGGVKMMYNGIPNDGKCINTGVDQQIGESKYNNSWNLPYGGYMYNKSYSMNVKYGKSDSALKEITMTSSYNYYYGTGVTYDSGSYSLVDVTQNTWSSTYSSSSGLYTCKSTTSSTCSQVYYIVAATNGYAYVLEMTNGHLLDYYNFDLVLGTGYNENNGTYTLTDTIAVSRYDWYSNYSSYNNYYTCGNGSTSCDELKYIIFPYKDKYYSILVNDEYVYSNSFSYDATTNMYTLDNDRVQFWDISSDTSKESIKTHHYTCFNLSGVCRNLSYVYYMSLPKQSSRGQSNFDYINLSNGKGVEDALDDMLYGDDVNNYNSTIKSYIDNWYSNNMVDYTDYLENSIFCNDRSMSTTSSGGWNPNGGSILDSARFGLAKSLKCSNDTDKFSVDNPKAKLLYPVGLMSRGELSLTINPTYNVGILKTGTNYWLGSPAVFSSVAAYGYYVGTSGLISYQTFQTSYGVRPAISLKPGTIYYSGDGSKNNPYSVGLTHRVSISNQLFRIDNVIVPGTNVIIYSDDYIVTSFKLNGVSMSGDSFIMPNEDVFITDVEYIPANYAINNLDSSISLPNTGRYKDTIVLNPIGDYVINSFYLDGVLVEGNSFVMPSHSVTISNISKVPFVVVESNHNPYSNNLRNYVYYENTFEGATALNIEFTYQTESLARDWIYLYNIKGSSSPYNNKKYGGTGKKTENITIDSNYIKIVFNTDSSGNDYYGFRAFIVPVYD